MRSERARRLALELPVRSRRGAVRASRLGAPLRGAALLAATLLLAAGLLLAGCASLPLGPLARERDPGPGREVRPLAPPEYDVLVALDHQSRGRLDEALAAFERALAKDPDSAYLHQKLAAALIRAGRTQQSLEHAERALELAPGDPRTRIFLGQLHRMRRDVEAAEAALLDASGKPFSAEAGALLYQVYIENDRGERAVAIARWMVDAGEDANAARAALARAYAQIGEFEKATQTLREAIALDPENLQLYAQLARLARESGKPGAEQAVYREILKLRPRHHATLMALADAQLSQDDRAGALSTLREIETHYPDDLRSVVRLGFLYYEAEQLGESAARFESFLASEPNDYEVRFFLGIVRRRMADDAAAIEAFSAIPPHSEHYAEARTQLALLYERQPDFARALAEIRSALAAKPTRPRELYAASLQAKAGDFEGAVAFLEGLLLKNPDDDELLFNLGVVYGEAKRTQEALDYMQRAIEQNPQNASALNYVGYTWAERGHNLDLAEEYIVRALDLQPDDGFIVDSLGWVYYMRARPLFETGRSEEAKKYLDRALKELLRAQELTGGDPVVSEHLGDTYLLLNEKQRALEKYEEAVNLEPREGEQPDLLEKLEALRREIK
ncbi:MAG TPA: tetratricopeptide repeat protein [Myxococcota bacterium]|nr:tetratricopeptide repeat protein [Myxococcota bacterium]